MHGNSGQDTASYIDASAAVTANLANRLLNAGDAQGDQYDSVEDLVGSKFNDKLTGSSVANSIDGGAGKDILTGGKGADHFVFGKSYGSDTISDFEFGSTKHDIIDLSDAVGISDYRDLVRNHISDAGHNVLITAADGAKLTLMNIEQLSSLVQTDFLF